MKNTENIRQAFKKVFYMLLFFVGMALIFMACDKDSEVPTKEKPPTENPDGQGQDGNGEPKDSVPDTTGEIDPDVLSDYLVLKDAVKMEGTPPSGPDGQIKINIKDTIYVLNGYSVGSRINFKHNKSQHITGFYLYVEGASYYYDVPSELPEGTFWIDPDMFLQSGPSANSKIPVPEPDPNAEPEPMSAIEIAFKEWRDEEKALIERFKLQPHDETGAPVDEFVRVLKIERPVDFSCSDITLEEIGYHWLWEATIRENSSGTYLLNAPGLAFDLDNNGSMGGCCNDICDCSVWPPYNGCNEQSDFYKVMQVNEFYVALLDVLTVHQGGTAEVFAFDYSQNVDRDSTNLCKSDLPVYIQNRNIYEGEGTHNFTPGASTLRLDFNGFSGFAKPPVNSEIAYSCNTLILIYGSEGDKFYKIYRAWNGSEQSSNYNVLWHD